MTITEFLEARIAEDEKLARDAIDDDMGQDGGFGDAFDYLTKGDVLPRFGEAAARMIVWDTPRRILAECAAKRAIIELHGSIKDDGWKSGAANDYLWCGSCGSIDDSPEPHPCQTIRALAAVHASHPDYQKEWAV